jgi:hypothetical protein
MKHKNKASIIKVKKLLKTPIVDFPFYEICSQCAEKLGGKWPEGHIATMVLKTCEYCGGKNQKEGEFISPYVDYDWPAKKTKHLRD